MKIACAGGGTLGSVTPLLAIAEELQAHGPLTVDWFGTATGPERALVEAAGYSFHTLPGGKLRRYFSLDNITDLGRIVLAFLRALGWFARHDIDALLTAGSFVAVPVGWAAWCCGVPVLVHQQDVRSGLANKLLAPIARCITVSLERSLADFPRYKTTHTGNPVRRGFAAAPPPPAARRALGLEHELATIVITGGGTGAARLNSVVAAAMPQLTELGQVLHLTGLGKAVSALSSARYHVQPFTVDTLPAFAAADVVVTRAGMGTLTELAALRRAAVVIPIAGTHQVENAELISAQAAGQVIDEQGLTPTTLIGTVRQLLSDKAAREAAGAALQQLLPNGTAAVTKVVERMVTRRQ